MDQNIHPSIIQVSFVLLEMPLSVPGQSCLHTLFMVPSSCTWALPGHSYKEELRFLLFCGSKEGTFSKMERDIVG